MGREEEKAAIETKRAALDSKWQHYKAQNFGQHPERAAEGKKAVLKLLGPDVDELERLEATYHEKYPEPEHALEYFDLD